MNVNPIRAIVYQTQVGWEFDAYDNDGVMASGTAPTVAQVHQMLGEALDAEYGEGK